MSSNLASISRSENPRIDAFMYTFSRPVSSGWNPLPSSSMAARRPRVRISPEVGRTMPAMHFSNVDFPEPLCPIRPRVWPCGISSAMSLSAQKSS